MFAIFLLVSIALFYLNLLGITLLVGRYLPLPLARASAVLGLTLVLFFIEHFVGLGQISWLWPVSSAAAGWILYRHRAHLLTRAVLVPESVFLLAFAYGLIWKCLLPDIYPSSERVTDLYFMSNYFQGATLPPTDQWYAGHHFDFYYSFQHYGAALLGRWFGWPIGMALNIGFVLLMALSLSLAWDFVSRFVTSRLARSVLIVSLALGGTGISPLLDLFVTDAANAPPSARTVERMWASARFIGSYDARVNTELGLSLFPPLSKTGKPAPDFEPRELPLENFGYQFFLGDYHPPLGSFCLLFFMLALIGWRQRPQGGMAGNSETTLSDNTCNRLCQGLLALCLPVMLVTNTWILPMQAILFVLWLAWMWWHNEQPDWRALVAGGGAGFVLIYPFLTHFATHAIQTPIRFVHDPDHTNVLRFLALMWPLVLLFGLALLDARKRPLALLFVAAFALMMLGAEFTWVDDPSVGRYERTNTTMKWWGWMWSGALLSCGTMALASSRAWVRWFALAVVAIPCYYLVPTLQYLANLNVASFARLDGKEWFVKDVPVATTVNFLKEAPPGIVLENWLGDAYTNQTLYALFSGKPSLMGWPSHISLWHNAAPDVWLLRQEVVDFYKGATPDPLGWLLQHDVRYVVWGHTERSASNWEQINAAIAGRYDWRPSQNQASYRVGVWVRR